MTVTDEMKARLTPWEPIFQEINRIGESLDDPDERRREPARREALGRLADLAFALATCKFPPPTGVMSSSGGVPGTPGAMALVWDQAGQFLEIWATGDRVGFHAKSQGF